MTKKKQKSSCLRPGRQRRPFHGEEQWHEQARLGRSGQLGGRLCGGRDGDHDVGDHDLGDHDLGDHCS